MDIGTMHVVIVAFAVILLTYFCKGQFLNVRETFYDFLGPWEKADNARRMAKARRMMNMAPVVPLVVALFSAVGVGLLCDKLGISLPVAENLLMAALLSLAMAVFTLYFLLWYYYVKLDSPSPHAHLHIFPIYRRVWGWLIVFYILGVFLGLVTFT